jgi:outer membrane lipoprotein-sorting protein
MWLSLATLLLGVAPGQDEAQELFKRMEQQILKCKTLDAQMEFAVTDFPADKGVKGRLLVARGNRMRWEIDMTVAGMPRKVTTVSDGDRMRTIGAVARQNDQVPRHMAEIALSSVTRGGVWMTMYAVLENQDPAKEYKDFDPDKSFAVSNFELGTKEMMAGKEAQVLEYKATIAGQPFAVTVWIDTRTHLPLKRVLKGGPNLVLVTETYTKVVLDKKVDDKGFEIPK